MVKSTKIFKKEMLLILDKKLLELPQGGTAVGSGINAHKQVFKNILPEELSTKFLGSKLKFISSSQELLSQGLSAQDCSVQLSGELKESFAVVSTMKVAQMIFEVDE